MIEENWICLMIQSSLINLYVQAKRRTSEELGVESSHFDGQSPRVSRIS